MPRHKSKMIHLPEILMNFYNEWYVHNNPKVDQKKKV